MHDIFSVKERSGLDIVCLTTLCVIQIFGNNLVDNSAEVKTDASTNIEKGEM